MQLKRFEAMRPRGRMVELGEGRAAYVFPVGALHLVRFSKAIKNALSKLAHIEVYKDSTPEERSRTVLFETVPIIIEDLLGLVEDTTVLGLLDQDDNFYPDDPQQFGETPHWDLPPLVEEWLDLSFGEERKRRPWIQAVEKSLHRLTGQKVSISEMLSNKSSQPDTESKTSSNESSAPTEG